MTANDQKKWVVLSSLILLLISFLIGLAMGSVPIAFGDTLAALFGTASSTQTDLVIEQIRMPRALLAAMVGALLGICGAATQGLFRNPLADPSLIGVTAGAAAGAAATIFFASSVSVLSGLSGIAIVSIGAFIGGSLSVVLVYMLATTRQGTSVATMLLAGIAITAVAGGLTSLVEFFASNDMLRRISIWRMGGLDGANYNRVFIVTGVSIFVLALLPRYSTALNALLLGESEARHLGLNVQSIKLRLIALVALGVGSSVALAGTISFVGLVIPHIMRLLVGPDHRWLLPLSALGGAVLLLLSDVVARTVIAPVELPVGLVTALLGAPFFISLLRRRHEFAMQ